MSIETKCNYCGKPANGYEDVQYGFHNGKPFVVVICKECREKLTNEQVVQIGQNKLKEPSVNEELGILGE